MKFSRHDESPKRRGSGFPLSPSLSHVLGRRLLLVPLLLACCLPPRIGAAAEEVRVADAPSSWTTRRRRRRTVSRIADTTDLVCQLHVNRVLPADGRVHGAVDVEFTTCSPWIAALGGTQGVYRVETPDWIMNEYRHTLLEGLAVYLVVPNGSTADSQIIIPSPSDVTVIVDSPPSDQEDRRLQRRRETKNTVMLRIRGYDSEPDFSLQELRRYLLEDDLSARRQLERCSRGTVTMDASRYGVLDVPIESNVEGLTNMEVMNLAETYVNEVILASDRQVDSIRSWADFLIFVIPPGTGAWAAFATISGKQSVFNDRWGGYLGALLHELGHNMGLDHAYEDGVEYDGITGYMGNVPTEVLTPQRCYNAHNHFKMQWFQDRVLEVEPEFPQIVTLAPFVQYDSTASDEYIIVRVGHLFMQYNRAISYNADSGEYPDTLVVVRERDNRQGTDLLVGLDLGEDYRDDDGNERITVHVCDRNYRGGAFGADILTVSVGYGDSLCNVREPGPVVPALPRPAPPRPAPVPRPAPAPRPVPRPAPPDTLAPSTPAPPPTATPSKLPATDDTDRRPTMAPTVIVGDSLDGGGLAGIQEQQESPKDGGGLIGILTASISLLVALLVVFVVYVKFCRTSKVPSESPSVHKGAGKDDDTEKGSVHSGDSNSTVSSEESFETEVAVSPSVKAASILPFQTVGRSLAHSIATSCALAGTVQEDDDAEVAISNDGPRTQQFHSMREKHGDSPASMLASARMRATTMLSSTKVRASPPGGTRRTRQRSQYQSEQGGTSSSDTGQDASWSDWLNKFSSWIPCEHANHTTDMLNNICGYGLAHTSTEVRLKRKDENDVIL